MLQSGQTYFKKSCGVNTARFLKYVWPFCNMHEMVNPSDKMTLKKNLLWMLMLQVNLYYQSIVNLLFSSFHCFDKNFIIPQVKINLFQNDLFLFFCIYSNYHNLVVIVVIESGLNVCKGMTICNLYIYSRRTANMFLT